MSKNKSSVVENVKDCDWCKKTDKAQRVKSYNEKGKSTFVWLCKGCING